MVATISSTVSEIRTKVRRLTGSPSTAQLSNDDLDRYINTAYSEDLPADIKSNLFREVVEVYVEPNVDRYALAGTLANNTGPNTYESIREPVYVEGRRAAFYKDRGQFYSDFPRTASLNTSLSGSVLSGNVTGVNVAGDPTNVITTADTTGLSNGDSVTFSGIGGSVELNGGTFVIANVTATTFEVTLAGVAAYTSGGTWNKQQVLNIGAPVLQNELVIGGKFAGVYTTYKDDGDPSGTGTGQIVNTSTLASIGTVVYATGLITVNFPSPLDSGETISTWYYTYTTSRPHSVLWWKNELIVRPVPDRVYKIEVEAYKYPTQFTQTTDTPVLNQWFQYIALLAAIKVLQDRQDMEGIENLTPIANRQERLIRNRIANEQIGMRNSTIYEGSEQTPHPFFSGYF